jgi:hypothetical protein
MAGFIPAIHVFFRAKTWMRGTSPRMTELISETRSHAALRLAHDPGFRRPFDAGGARRATTA